jgi:microcystin-dependent protein
MDGISRLSARLFSPAFQPSSVLALSSAFSPPKSFCIDTVSNTAPPSNILSTQNQPHSAKDLRKILDQQTLCFSGITDDAWMRQQLNFKAIPNAPHHPQGYSKQLALTPTSIPYPMSMNVMDYLTAIYNSLPSLPNIHIGPPGAGATAAPLSCGIVGEIVAWPTDQIPDGFLECNGQIVSRTDYPELYAALGVKYGLAGIDMFKLPDYRGYFLRGWDHGIGIDPNAIFRTNRGDGTTGDAVGTKQSSATQLPTNITITVSSAGGHTHVMGNAGSHQHILSGQDNDARPTGGASNEVGNVENYPSIFNRYTSSAGDHSHPIYSAGEHTHTAQILGGDAETRPTNVNVMYLIRARPNSNTGQPYTEIPTNPGYYIKSIDIQETPQAVQVTPSNQGYTRADAYTLLLRVAFTGAPNDIVDLECTFNAYNQLYTPSGDFNACFRMTIDGNPVKNAGYIHQQNTWETAGATISYKQGPFSETGQHYVDIQAAKCSDVDNNFWARASLKITLLGQITTTSVDLKNLTSLLSSQAKLITELQYQVAAFQKVMNNGNLQFILSKPDSVFFSEEVKAALLSGGIAALPTSFIASYLYNKCLGKAKKKDEHRLSMMHLTPNS